MADIQQIVQLKKNTEALISPVIELPCLSEEFKREYRVPNVMGWMII